MSWYLYLSRKFYQRSKWSFLVIPILTLISQTSQLLAFLLPLKVLILLGTPEIPSYFPTEMTQWGRKPLIVVLASIAVVLYILHAVVEKLETWLILREARELVVQANKITLYSNQNEIVRNAYRHFSRSTAGFFFIILALVCLAALYPTVIAFFSVYILSCVLLLWLLSNFFKGLAEWMETKNLEMANGIGSVGFLLVFLFIIYDAFQQTAPSILFGIIALLLFRQILTQARIIGASLRALFRQQEVTSALLFHKELPDSLTVQDGYLWQQLNSDNRDNWIRNIVAPYLGKIPEQITARWFQTGVADVFAYEVILAEDGQNFLVKVFDTKRTLLAKNEALILSDIPSLPSPKLLAVEVVEGFHCHLFHRIEGEKPRDPDRIWWQMELFESLMLEHLPSEILINQYQRTHPLLWQRLNTQWLNNLNKVANNLDEQAQRDVGWLEQHNKAVCQILKDLPLTVIHSGINRDTLIRDNQTNRVAAIQWGSWKLEPWGAGWPIRVEYLDRLESFVVNMLQESKPKREIVYSSDVRLSALMYALESFCRYQNFVAAVELLPQVRQCLEFREQSRISSK